MYCTKCGNQVNDGAKFCTKCGQQFNKGSQIYPAAILHKKTNYLVFVVIGIIIILLLLVIRFLVKNEDTGLSLIGEDAGLSLTNEDTGELYDNGCLNFAAIIMQCEYCETPLNTLVEFCDLGTAYGYDKDKIDACSIKKYNEMQHNCTADVIQVENIPYVYRGCYGTYSGDWQGAGPVGTGTFIGEQRLSSGMIAYTGDWKYGLPEGEGELYIINSIDYRGNDFKYVGQVSAGLRNGTGYLYEYAPGASGFYRIYDQSVYQNDILAVETDAVRYDLDTGEVIYYERFIGEEESGWYCGLTAQWGANELSPEQKKLMDYVMIGAIGYIIYKTVDSAINVPESYDYEKSNQEMLAKLEESRAKEQAELLERQAREAKEAEKTRKWNEDKYYEALYNDPDEYYIQTKNYKYNAGLGY